jgi:hypothetical protein
MSIYAIARAQPRASALQLARQTAGGLIVAVVAAAVTLYTLRIATVSGVAALIVSAGALWFLTTTRTQLALALYMLYLGLLDGYLKLASGSSYVTLVRDALLFALVIGLLVRATVQHRRLPMPPLGGWVIAFVIIVFVQIANPLGGTVVHSLAGVRQHLEFVPLFFLTYAYVRSVKALRTFVIVLAVIAAANGVAGLIQFNETTQQFAAWGPGYAQRVLGEGIFAQSGRSFATGTPGVTATRPFGLGSDAGDGGLFAAFAFCGILALASFSHRRRYLLFSVVMALGAVVAIVTSQDRGVVVSSVLIVLAFGFLTTTSRNRITGILGLALAALVSVFVIAAIVGSVGSGALRYQGLTPNSLVKTTSKARGLSIAAIPHNLVTYPFGAGLATAGPASLTTAGASQLTISGDVDTETEFSFLIVETGVAGMVVLTVFTITLLVLSVRRCRREPDPEARVLLAAVTAPLAGILALFFTSALTPSVPGGPYLWAAGGIISYWLIELPATRHRQSHAPRDIAAPLLPSPRRIAAGTVGS